jgi:hypothetical protein
VLAEFLAWIFLHDDVYDEAGEAHDPDRLAGYVAILDGVGPRPGAPAAALALADLRRKLVHLGGARWFPRFAASMRRFWLDGVLAETRHRAQQITPTIERYQAVRLESVGVYPVLDLVEAAYGITLSPRLVDDPLLDDVRRLAASAIAMSNDVFSYEKERRAGDAHNLVYLLTVHAGKCLDDAFASVVAAHNDLVARLDGVAAPLERSSPALRLYVKGCRRWMKGAHDWQRGSRRYACPRRQPQETERKAGR